MTTCHLCGARWDLFDWSDDCRNCGGGALERACMTCDGACGQIWDKAVTDSNERGATWRGGCGLPVEDQRALFRRKHPEGDDSRWTYRQVTQPRPDRTVPPRPRDRVRAEPPPRLPPPPDPRTITAHLVPPSRTLRELVGFGGATAYHTALVGRVEAVVTRWQGIHHQGSHGEPGWSKANYRFAGAILEAIRGIDPRAARTARAVFLEVVRLIDATPWGDPSEPGSVFDELRRALAG